MSDLICDVVSYCLSLKLGYWETSVQGGPKQ